MHEFALAQNIVAAVEEHTQQDFPRLTVLHIEVGEFAGVVTDSLQFGLEVSLKDKNLEDVRIEITKVPATAQCQCNHRYNLSDMFEACPQCKSYEREILSGTDVIIKSVEVN